MEIDLREVQALHARYAREHFVIDLEGQVRALPAPLQLSHEPAASMSPVRRAWNARWQLGRGALMTAGAATICAALGVGAAHLWPMVHNEQAQAPGSPSLQPGTATQVQAGGPPDAPALAASAPALTSKDLLTDNGRANWSAAVDPAALLRQAPRTRESELANPATPPRTNEEQKALASPLRQHVTHEAQPVASATAAVKPAPDAVPTAAAAPSAPKEDQPAPRHVVRRMARAHTSPARTEQPTSTETARQLAAPVQRNGDVQLF